MMDCKLITTADGSHTLYVQQIDEPFHSVNGAITESNHVFVNNGYLFSDISSPVVLEIGFGTGLNCLLTALQAEKLRRPTTYFAIEKNPLKTELVQQLNYCDLLRGDSEDIFSNIHKGEWSKMVNISSFFRLQKLQMDITNPGWRLSKSSDVIYFDAFGPDKQAELWTSQIFSDIYKMTRDNGIFVTYSAKGEVRRRLSAVGFKMERLPGPPGKKEMLRGIKI